MKRLLLAVCIALMVLVPLVAFAQNRTPPAGATSSGQATARGGETGGSSGSSNASTSGGASSGVSGGYSTPGGAIGTGAGGYGAPSAISRDSGMRSGETSGARVRGGEAHGSSGVGQPVPGEMRPRGDLPAYGRAVPRGSVTPGKAAAAGNAGGNGWPDSSPYIWLGYAGSPYSYYGWNPNSFNYWYSPYPWLTPWGGFVDPFAWEAGSAAVGGVYSNPDTGKLRFKVKPKDAEVWVDGFFEGPVSAYDGTFEGLRLKGGTHRVEIKAKGYEPLAVDVRVMPGRNVTYTGDLKPIAVK